MSPKGGTRRSALGMQLLRWAAIAAVAWFAVQGGEYSTTALVRQRLAARAARRAIDSLGHAVDSLTRYKQAVMTDPAVQERIAREEFGMIKGKEILYRFAEPTDSGKDTKRP